MAHTFQRMENLASKRGRMWGGGEGEGWFWSPLVGGVSFKALLYLVAEVRKTSAWQALLIKIIDSKWIFERNGRTVDRVVWTEENENVWSRCGEKRLTFCERHKLNETFDAKIVSLIADTNYKEKYEELSKQKHQLEHEFGIKRAKFKEMFLECECKPLIVFLFNNWVIL